MTGINRQYEKQGIGKHYYNAKLEDFECIKESQVKALEAIKNYDWNKNLVIYGFGGSGKTHLLSALAKQNTGMQICDLFEIAMRVADAKSYLSSESIDDVFNELLEIPVMTIDDIGIVTDELFEPQFINFLLAERCEEHKPTILCTRKDLSGGISGFGSIFDENVIHAFNDTKIVFWDWFNHWAGSFVATEPGGNISVFIPTCLN